MSQGLVWRLVVALVVVAVAGLLVQRVVLPRMATSQVPVTKAQPVVELATSDVLQARVRELAQGLPLSGSLKAANSALVKARVAGELQGLTLREGDAVKAGQVIARIDPADSQARLNQAQQQADSAKTQIDTAQRQWDNNKALVDQGFISKTALDTSQNNLSAAQSNHRAALAAVDLARKGMQDTVLRAPISGVIAQRLAQPGERVGVDARIVEIVDLSQLELEAALSAADSVGVRVGQAASLQIEGSSRAVSARVARINPSAQAGSRSVLIYLTMNDSTGLRQGLFAQGTLGTAQLSGVAVPLSAVRTDKPQMYVQTVENNQVAHKNVELGARGTDGKDSSGDTWVAVRGLAVDAVVIQGSVGTLREGTAIKFTAPPAVSIRAGSVKAP